jgi:hypothetical protein
VNACIPFLWTAWVSRPYDLKIQRQHCKNLQLSNLPLLCVLHEKISLLCTAADVRTLFSTENSDFLLRPRRSGHLGRSSQLALPTKKTLDLSSTGASLLRGIFGWLQLVLLWGFSVYLSKCSWLWCYSTTKSPESSFYWRARLQLEICRRQQKLGVNFKTALRRGPSWGFICTCCASTIWKIFASAFGGCVGKNFFTIVDFKNHVLPYFWRTWINIEYTQIKTMGLMFLSTMCSKVRLIQTNYIDY